MADPVRVKRKDIKTFLNTDPGGVSPEWSLIGDGVPTGKINMNPKSSKETYIHEVSSTTIVEGYEPEMPIEQVAKAGEPVFDFVDALQKARAIMDDATTEVVNVWLYQASYSGWYPAEKVNVAIAVDALGGDGGAAVKINYTIAYNGDPVVGWYNPSTGVFEASPILAGLTSLVFSTPTLTLTPVFDRDKLHYTTPTSATTGVITVVAEDPDAVVLIKNGVTTVANGGTATWVTGVNTVTVKVTVGDEEITYTVIVTKS